MGLGLTSAIHTASTGMRASEKSLNVSGTNLANANTIGYKAERADFVDFINYNYYYGQTPGQGFSAGTNPQQIGMGVELASVTTDFSQGSFQEGMTNSDIGINGNGFLVVRENNNSLNYFTRNGALKINENFDLTTNTGLYVMGYGVDDKFRIQDGVLTNLKIPVGEMHIAEATQNVKIEGLLDAAGQSAAQGTVLKTEPLRDAATGNAITETTLLNNVQQLNGTDYVNVFENGTLSFTPTKGGQTLKTATLDITDATTVNDYLSFLDEAFGIRSIADGVPADQGIIGKTINGGDPGAAIINGSLYLLGNSGELNALELDTADMTLNTHRIDLRWGGGTSADTQNAVGTGVGTTLQVFDSLGAAVDVRLNMVLESKSNTETVYRWYADSPDNQPSEGQTAAAGTGIIRFDQNGKLISAAGTKISVERTQLASESPLTFEFDLDVSSLQAVKALATDAPQLTQTEQDGAGAGTLFDYSIEKDGIITGYFSSGVNRTIGKIPLATFRNQEGLYKAGDSLYRESTNSGDAKIGTAGQDGVGVIKSNALELSNTDIGGEIVQMILDSAMYRANAKIMTTSNEMYDALLRIT
ncbi:MAG: flagellar hook-basal body complex protein [Planctomycetaceae bacterium]|jgi:flagellar hook protein FlgE|nr:flagellar hook-basal body complex protein [Planctomycetaceae bacterium]